MEIAIILKMNKMQYLLMQEFPVARPKKGWKGSDLK